ncbi:MAG TPA: FHA domain-containing protein [Myxococcota bacterium]|nr:FHA domain-containing protein [Myxococcota bacterium]
MSVPSVRLLLKGQLVDEVAFRGPMLRIGRMKENEVVINNLSVSRFHATLSREGDAYVLRDLGSENGCWVNGERVTEARVGPADAILIGKHQLELVTGSAASAAAPQAAPPRGRSDAWDAANTYLVGVETRAKMLESAAPGGAADVEAALVDDAPLPAPVGASDVGSGVELFGDDLPGDLAEADLAEFDVSELELAAEPAAADAGAPAAIVAEAASEDDLPIAAEEEPTLLVDEVAAEPAPPASPVAAPIAAAPARPAPEPPAQLHAGVIVQRKGKLERVVPWEGERLTLGRAVDCDVCLATAEVSRRHALLVREGERYEVRDLESINGTYVNGSRVTRRTLQVGDVIRIEDFELTFVLDRAPLGDAVQAPATAAVLEPDAGGLTQLGEVLDLAPFVASESEDDADAMSFDALPPVVAEPPGVPAATPAPEVAAALSFDAEPSGESLLVEDVLVPGDEDKDLAATEVVPAALAPASPTVRFELAVRVDELPPKLREALASLDEPDLLLPVELRLARD